MENRIQTISIRVEPSLKAEAESILKELGVSTSSLFTMLLKQVVIKRGVPFEINLQHEMPINIDKMSKEEILKELEKGENDLKTGKVKDFKKVEQSLKKKYNL